MQMADKIIMRPVEALIPYARNCASTEIHRRSGIARGVGVGRAEARSFRFCRPKKGTNTHGVEIPCHFSADEPMTWFAMDDNKIVSNWDPGAVPGTRRDPPGGAPNRHHRLANRVQPAPELQDQRDGARVPPGSMPILGLTARRNRPARSPGAEERDQHARC
jgi:hypothetical protein